MSKKKNVDGVPTKPEGTPRSTKRQSRKSNASKKESVVTVLEHQPQKTPAKAKPADVSFEEAIEKTRDVIFAPNPGPQTEFLAASEQEVLYGGAAGGEPKSWFYRLLSL